MIGPPGSLDGDINADGAVNHADRSLLTAAWGRNATEPPTVPTAGGPSCGDIVPDNVVDAHDLSEFMEAYLSLGPSGGPCPLLENWGLNCVGDLNEDARVDENDLSIITENQGRYLLDLNCDGNIDGTDLGIFLASQGCADDDPPSNYNAIADTNCDMCVNHADLDKILDFCWDCTECEP